MHINHQINFVHFNARIVLWADPVFNTLTPLLLKLISLFPLFIQKIDPFSQLMIFPFRSE
ncbi:hypothetical protein M8C21_026546 [Ambrosia artemisiifolia]|uniref:Uncharacterized protein n=1 Tax=Ambrosia artemisiifolia TaxID=4212 RepID=A0AAD5C4L4_AMBAR|nr:hypothetical protein M8C21_026546 [Ambrosia artemisiifolia]